MAHDQNPTGRRGGTRSGTHRPGPAGPSGPRRTRTERARGARMQQPSFTLGVEEEYQIVDTQTRALRSHIGRMLEDQAFDELELKPELHQSMVEVATPVCRTPAEVRTELLRLRGTMNRLLA